MDKRRWKLGLVGILVLVALHGPARADDFRATLYQRVKGEALAAGDRSVAKAVQALEKHGFLGRILELCEEHYTSIEARARFCIAQELDRRFAAKYPGYAFAGFSQVAVEVSGTRVVLRGVAQWKRVVSPGHMHFPVLTFRAEYDEAGVVRKLEANPALE